MIVVRFIQGVSRKAFAAKQLVIIIFILLASFMIGLALWNVLCSLELIGCGG